MKHTLLVAVMSLTAFTMLWAEDTSKSLYFSGWLTEVNPAAKTFSIRSHNKILVFTVDIRRCWITQDGSVTRRNLGWAKVGDAVMGRVSVAKGERFVKWVEFTRKPKPGKPVAGKPGFLASPYGAQWTGSDSFQTSFDARDLPQGAMIFDHMSKKIFLVP
jgi:hypothetical protein